MDFMAKQNIKTDMLKLARFIYKVIYFSSSINKNNITEFNSCLPAQNIIYLLLFY